MAIFMIPEIEDYFTDAKYTGMVVTSQYHSAKRYCS